MKLKEALERKLTKKEKESFTRAFDMIGDIAIIEIKKELERKEKMIAEKILELNKHIKTVCKKSGAHKGRYRRQKLKIIGGEKRKTTIYKENGARMRFNVETSYFSPRLSTERKRISQFVKPNEDVLVMFSGVAPYPLVISGNTKAREIVGIEMNPEAHKFALENTKLNKAKNIKLFLGDVKKVLPKLRRKFDRILMPLPKTADEFLGVALKAAKKGTAIHFYDFLNEDEFDLAIDKIKKSCRDARKKCRITRIVKCGQHAPHIFRICVDFKVS